MLKEDGNTQQGGVAVSFLTAAHPLKLTGLYFNSCSCLCVNTPRANWTALPLQLCRFSVPHQGLN